MDYGSQTKCFAAGLAGKADYDRFLCFCTTPVCNGRDFPSDEIVERMPGTNSGAAAAALRTAVAMMMTIGA